MFAVNKLNLFTNKVPSTVTKNIFFYISARPKKETQKKIVENMCITANNFIYRDCLWGRRTVMLDVKLIKVVLIPATLIDIVGGLPRSKNKC